MVEVLNIGWFIPIATTAFTMQQHHCSFYEICLFQSSQNTTSCECKNFLAIYGSFSATGMFPLGIFFSICNFNVNGITPSNRAGQGHIWVIISQSNSHFYSMTDKSEKLHIRHDQKAYWDKHHGVSGKPGLLLVKQLTSRTENDPLVDDIITLCSVLSIAKVMRARLS